MNDNMKMDEQSAKAAFRVGDVIHSGGRQAKLQIVDLTSEGIRIQSTNSKSSKFFKYCYIQVVIDGFTRIIEHSVHESIQPVLLAAGEKKNYWTENYAYGIARAFRELAAGTAAGSPDQSGTQANLPSLPSTRQGFLISAAERVAIEKYAVDLAIAHYGDLGFKVTVHGKPFDLHCAKNGKLLYVEVKGTQGAGLKILLTSGEVHFNAEHGEYMALFVVSEILLSPDLSPSGGVTKIVCPWHIEAASLTPIGFSCTV